MSKTEYVWALFDNRAGNRNQLLGILNELKMPYLPIELNYNKLALLPNFIIQACNNFIHIKNNDFLLKAKSPCLIISCGRRTAPVALGIASRLKIKPFLVQLMYPRATLKKSLFDLIITPSHDTVPNKNNIFSVLGTPNQIRKQIKHNKPLQNSKNLNKPIITVLIGGDHNRYKLTSKIISEIFDYINKKLKNKGTILISTSRRTNNKVIDYINSLKISYSNIKQIYHPNRQKKNNPVINFLKTCEEVVVTGDSMSMVSEACELKKPVRIFYNKSICSPKQINFCKNIINNKYAFTFETFRIKCKNIKTLNSSRIVAKEIKKRIIF